MQQSQSRGNGATSGVAVSKGADSEAMEAATVQRKSMEYHSDRVNLLMRLLFDRG